MRTANIASQATRMSDVGLVWELLNDNASTTQEIQKYSALHIYAVADCVVTIDGKPSIKVMAGQTAIINVGPGIRGDKKPTVTVEFSANVNLSVASDA